MNEQAALAALRDRPLNFDPETLWQRVAAGGWRHDRLCEPLPREPPGDPVPGGTWHRARALMNSYQTADPSMVRATFDRDAPLAGRTMLLTLRFLFLRIRAGVRVGDVYDEERQENGRRARVYGWNYRTLEGHFEQGEMAYEVWKWLDTGEVEFRIDAASKTADSGPWILRLGFRLVGRRPQLAFYRRAAQRVAELVAR